MKTGIELIQEERRQQIEKHDFSARHDDMYCNYELMDAAKFCLTLNEKHYPEEWGDWFKENVKVKTYQSRLIIAGALIAAEIDRLQRLNSDNEINK